MERILELDLDRLKTLAFKRYSICGGLVREFHARKKEIDRQPEPELLWNVYDWLLTPYLLWPIEFAGLAKYALQNLQGPTSDSQRKSKSQGSSSAKSQTGQDKMEDKVADQVSAQLLELLRLIETPPPEETQAVVAEFERALECGRHERMLKQAQKFDEQEQALLQNQDLLADWNVLKKCFNVKRFQNRSGLIRRGLSQERGFREAKWRFDWSTEASRFHLLFDAFCYRWNLYGMEHDKPLLMKISINPTAHGTMIYIPRNWSLDPRRDLDWALINRLHRSRGAKRAGPKWSSGRVEKLELIEQVRKAYAEAKKRGLKGEKLHEFICEQTGRDSRGDDTWWRRVVKLQTSKSKPHPSAH